MKRGVNIRFSSKVPRGSLEALKELIYLNPHQARDEEGILRALAEYGHPKIHEVAEELRIHVGDHVPQSIFAYDEADGSGHPVGVVIFTRIDQETISIIHISVDPDYSMLGGRDEYGVGARLIQEVIRIGGKVTGINYVSLQYRRNILFKV